MEIKYGPRGTVPLEVFDGAVSLNCELLSRSTVNTVRFEIVCKKCFGRSVLVN